MVKNWAKTRQIIIDSKTQVHIIVSEECAYNAQEVKRGRVKMPENSQIKLRKNNKLDFNAFEKLDILRHWDLHNIQFLCIWLVAFHTFVDAILNLFFLN